MRTPRTPFALALTALLVSCGGGSTTPSNVLKIEKWPPSGDLQTDTVGRTLPKPIRVKVTLDGNVVGGYMVHFDGGDLGTDSMLSGSDGIATSTWTLGGQVGTQFVTASLAGAAGSPLTFSATGVAGAPAALIAVSGDGQIGGLHSYLSSPLVARLVDQFGNGVQGRWIQWSDSGLVTLGADSVITGISGDVTLNVHADTAGVAKVVASFGGVTGSPLLFTATLVDTVVSIDLSGSTYTPSSVTIPAGSAVKWIWGSGTHSVTPDSPGPIEDTGPLPGPHIYGPIIFPNPGVFNFHCTVHAGMTGTITVN